MSIVQDISFNSDIIKIRLDNYETELIARGDCCSESWFEYFITNENENENDNDNENKNENEKNQQDNQEDNDEENELDREEWDEWNKYSRYVNAGIDYFNNLQKCIGKKYIGHKHTNCSLTFFNTNKYDVLKSHICELRFEDGTCFVFVLRNDSNGYYDGYIDEETNLNIYPFDAKKNSIILLVGLPGSGKTTYGNSLVESIPNSIFYDDDNIESKKTMDIIRKNLMDGKKVIVAHPRLCISEVYHHFVNRLNLVDNSTSIVTYCFIPDKENSIKNIKRREKSKKRIDSFLTSLETLDLFYKEEFMNETYQCKKIQTYQKTK